MASFVCNASFLQFVVCDKAAMFTRSVGLEWLVSPEYTPCKCYSMLTIQSLYVHKETVMRSSSEKAVRARRQRMKQK